MVDDGELEGWFYKEVLPLERSLTAFIRKNWRIESEVVDLRQDIYERVLAGAARGLPLYASGYVYTVARNHLISRARRERIVRIDLVADLENIMPGADELTPERFASARQELCRVEDGLQRLPPRCREIVQMRKVDGLSSKEVSAQLGIGIDAVDQQTSKGMRTLADFIFGGANETESDEDWRSQSGRRAK